MYVSKETAIRVVSFTAAAMLILLGMIVKEGAEKRAYQSREETGWLRSLQESAGHVNSVAAAMEKAGYTGTAAGLAELSAQIRREAGAAKTALSSLPVDAESLSGTYRFLSQAGDFAEAMARKRLRGEALTERERADFADLARYAAVLNGKLTELERAASSGQVGVGDYFRIQAGALEPPDALRDLAGFRDVEDGFDGYPTLIYDGPFSDNIMKGEPELTRGMAQVDEAQAREAAAACMGLAAARLIRGPDEESRMPAYTFEAAGNHVAVTKAGGIAVYMVNGRSVGEKSVHTASARRNARLFLAEMGLADMAETYYEIANGVCTVNFAAKQDGAVLYTDLVKVGVAMDNGAVVSYDARGYVSNHRARDLPVPSLTAEQAKASLHGDLRIKSTKLALIPGPGGGEILAYEFLCAGKDRNVLVYVNAESGAEEQILLLTESENGVLTV